MRSSISIGCLLCLSIILPGRATELDSEDASDFEFDLSLPVAEQDAAYAAADATFDHIAFAPPAQVSLSSLLREQPTVISHS